MEKSTKVPREHYWKRKKKEEKPAPKKSHKEHYWNGEKSQKYIPAPKKKRT